MLKTLQIFEIEHAISRRYVHLSFVLNWWENYIIYYKLQL